jgi:hypothetical protein
MVGSKRQRRWDGAILLVMFVIAFVAQLSTALPAILGL